MNLKEALKDVLTERERRLLIRGFDIIGDVAIIEIPEPLRKKKKEIANAIKKIHKHIKTVLMKLGEREGKFRLREFEVLLGGDTRTEHKEHGCRFRLDVKTCYFSPREATERQRIAEKVKPGETVLVMFAGTGPYAIVIAKKQPQVRKIYSVEINPECVKYMKENIKINKVEDKILPILGDVRDVCREYYGKCDRVIMPLPKEGYKYLDIALMCIKSGGVIHFYHYSHENDLWYETLSLINRAAIQLNKKVRILQKRKVLPYGPRVWKVCVEFEVT